WADSWPEFSEELCLCFGLANWVREAAKNLESLHMKHRDKITTYNINFMWYSSQLDWGDSVFTHRYYKGLPNHLQDQISMHKQGKPHSFQEIMHIATVYDDCHWEHEREHAHTHTAENPTPSTQNCKNPSDNSSSQCQSSSSNNRPSSNPHSHNNKQQSFSALGLTNNNNKNNPQPPQQQLPTKSSTPTLSTSSSSNHPPAPKKDLSNILGKDSKLTEAEKQCHINKNLCSYCGIFGYQVKMCKHKEANQKAYTTTSSSVSPQTTLANALVHSSVDNSSPPTSALDSPFSATDIPQPSISLINAVAFLCTSCLPSSCNFCLGLSSVSAIAGASQVTDALVDLSNMPTKYHKFANIFSKARADTLTPH
ncbi:hypothetical protein AN958_03570, partial [Leucoagaricus sp. SymC.cos]